MTYSIHPETTLGYVHLTVANLDRSLAFYQHNLGLQLRRRQGQTAFLGAGGPDLLLLTEQPGARSVSGVTGLYHFAILTPSRYALAQSLRRLAETRTHLQGFADHGVSEAIYLADPDGNGIEIYHDRPREEWPWRNGQLMMVSDPLDVNGLMALEPIEPWHGLRPETILGHMHLHVAAIPAAEAFYCGGLGFELMQRFGPSAGFASAGGYHHHLGFNTWAGQNAPPPPPNAVGLRYFTIVLPHTDALTKEVKQLESASIDFKEKNGIVFLRDPSGNGLVLTTHREAGGIAPWVEEIRGGG